MVEELSIKTTTMSNDDDIQPVVCCCFFWNIFHSLWNRRKAAETETTSLESYLILWQAYADIIFLNGFIGFYREFSKSTEQVDQFRVGNCSMLIGNNEQLFLLDYNLFCILFHMIYILVKYGSIKWFDRFFLFNPSNTFVMY